MDSTDGLARGVDVVDTGAADLGSGRRRRRSAASGTCIGDAGRRQGRPATRRALADPPRPAGVRRAVAEDRDLRDRHQGHRPDRAVRQRRQGRPLRRRRRRQDGADPGADPQHRAAARRRLRLRRRRRAHARGQRPLARDDRVGRDRQGRARLRPDERAAGRAPARRPVRADDGGVLPRPGPGRAALHRQHLPLRPGGLRGVGAARPHAERGRLPADARHRDGRSCRSASPRRARGSITSVQAIYVPADDLTDPAPANTFAHLDATTVLSRAIVEKGIYPAVDPLDSSSRALQPGIVSRGALPDGDRACSRSSSATGPAGHHRHPRHGRAVGRGQADRRSARARSSASCRSRSSSPRQFTGTPGEYVQARGHDRAASTRSSTASTTTCPSRPSTWSARSRRPSRRPRQRERRRQAEAGRAPAAAPTEPDRAGSRPIVADDVGVDLARHAGRRRVRGRGARC